METLLLKFLQILSSSYTPGNKIANRSIQTLIHVVGSSFSQIPLLITCTCKQQAFIHSKTNKLKSHHASRGIAESSAKLSDHRTATGVSFYRGSRHCGTTRLSCCSILQLLLLESMIQVKGRHSAERNGGATRSDDGRFLCFVKSKMYQSHVEFYGERRTDFCRRRRRDGRQQWCIFTVKDIGAPSTDHG